MKTVQITADFSGYPNGKDEVVFTKGQTPDLANDYADLLIDKGLAREKPAETKTVTKAEKKDDAK